MKFVLAALIISSMIGVTTCKIGAKCGSLAKKKEDKDCENKECCGTGVISPDADEKIKTDTPLIICSDVNFANPDFLIYETFTCNEYAS